MFNILCLNSLTNFSYEESILSLLYRSRGCVSELSNLPKVTQLVTVRTKFIPRLILFHHQATCLCSLPLISRALCSLLVFSFTDHVLHPFRPKSAPHPTPTPLHSPVLLPLDLSIDLDHQPKAALLSPVQLHVLNTTVSFLCCPSFSVKPQFTWGFCLSDTILISPCLFHLVKSPSACLRIFPF